MSIFNIKTGDNRIIIKTIPNDCIDSIITDPPYELGFMGNSWDSTGIAYNVELWRECLRVLKPGGHMLAFSNSRTYHRMACAIEDAGFEIRDQLMWIYGTGFPKSNNGTTLKPAHEPIVLARKQLDGTVNQNQLKHGTGCLNIDACRIDMSKDDRKGARVPHHFLKYGIVDAGRGGHLRNGKTFEPHIKGRFPANVIHDGSDEAMKVFPGTDETSASRYFYCSKASKSDKNDGAENSHPTVKPTELMRYLCRLITPNGGTVLDPFTGSGSTGRGAILEGCDFIGIELSGEYASIANLRIMAAKKASNHG
jgi:DNA modification methylase